MHVAVLPARRNSVAKRATFFVWWRDFLRHRMLASRSGEGVWVVCGVFLPVFVRSCVVFRWVGLQNKGFARFIAHGGCWRAMGRCEKRLEFTAVSSVLDLLPRWAQTRRPGNNSAAR